MNYPTTRTLPDGRIADLFAWVLNDRGEWVVESTSERGRKLPRTHKGKTIEEIAELTAQVVSDYRNGKPVALDQFRHYE